MGVSLADVPQVLSKAIAVRREDITRAKQFILKQVSSRTLDVAESWVKEQQLEPVTHINFMNDDSADVLERIARGYSLYMAFFQAVWELSNSGEIAPLAAPELWKPHLEYRTPHGRGGIQMDIKCPYLPQIHRIALPDGMITDTDIFLQGVNCKTLHAGIREAIDQALGCFRRGLYMPATAMLAAAAEATWTECGVKVAAKLANAKLDGVVNDPYASISKKVPFVAVAICRTSHGNLHTGVVYRREDGTYRLFHQAWHHHTLDEPLQQGSTSIGGPFLCVVPSIPEERAVAIAEFWEFVASKGQPIGYALRDDERARFDPATCVLTLPNGVGLSCSTFVLVMFRSVNWPYLDTVGWPPGRPGDAEFQAGLVKLLERTGCPPDHVEAVKKEIGCARIRPEEVAGVALYPALPVRHPEAEDGGYFIRGSVHMRGLGPPPHSMS